MIKKHLNPADLPNWSESFSQVVAVRTGVTQTIYVSGQCVSGCGQFDSLLEPSEPGGFAQSTRRLFANTPAPISGDRMRLSISRCWNELSGFGQTGPTRLVR